jgi:hypothetical protein
MIRAPKQRLIVPCRSDGGRIRGVAERSKWIGSGRGIVLLDEAAILMMIDGRC